MILKILLLAMASLALVPQCIGIDGKVKFGISHLILFFVGSFVIFVLHVDQFWIYVVAAGKVSIMGLYEGCLALLEDEEVEHSMYLKRYLGSCVYIVLITLCLG